MMEHLNSFSSSGGGNLNKNLPKIQMLGGLPQSGTFKLRFDWYIIHLETKTALPNSEVDVHFYEKKLQHL